MAAEPIGQSTPMPGTMEIVLRPFHPGDMDGLYFLDRHCHDSERRIAYGRMLNTMLEKDITAIVAAEAQPGLSETIAGAMIIRSEPWHGRLNLLVLMVHPDFRRLGIARRLVSWAGRIGCGSGFRELAIAQNDGPQFNDILQGLGFRREEQVVHSYRDGIDVPLWVRSISPAEGL